LDRAGNAEILMLMDDYKHWSEQTNVNHYMVQVEKYTGGQ
jgi:hypothetical protein